jgi:hypothetical protein
MNVVRIRQRATRVVLTYLTIALLFLSTPVSLNARCCFDGVNCDECPPGGACLCWDMEYEYDTGFWCRSGWCTYRVITFWCNTWPFGYYNCVVCWCNA